MRASLLGVVIIAALGGLLFGFDTAVISGTTAALESFRNRIGMALIRQPYTNHGTLLYWPGVIAAWPGDRVSVR